MSDAPACFDVIILGIEVVEVLWTFEISKIYLFTVPGPSQETASHIFFTMNLCPRRDNGYIYKGMLGKKLFVSTRNICLLITYMHGDPFFVKVRLTHKSISCANKFTEALMMIFRFIFQII